MAKQTITQAQATTTATDEQGNVLVAEIISPEQYQASLIQTLKSEVPDKAIDQMEAECAQLQIHGTGDKEGYKAVTGKITAIKSLASQLDKKRKELKDPFRKIGEAIDAEAKRLDGRLRGIQAKLEEKRKAIDDAIAAEKEAEERRLTARYEARVKVLSDMGVPFNTVTFQVGLISASPAQIKALEDEPFDALCAKFKSELDMLKAEAERKAKEEEARKAKAEAEAAEAKRKADEAAAELAAKNAELERMKAELEAMKAAQAAAAAPAPQPTTTPPPAATAPPANQEPPVLDHLARFPKGNDFHTSQPAQPRPSGPSWAPGAAPQAQQQTQQAPSPAAQPKPESTFSLTESQVILQRIKGFDKARQLILARVSDSSEKLTRAGLVDFINALDPTVCSKLK